MLGVNEVPFESAGDRILKDIGGHLGCADTFRNAWSRSCSHLAPPVAFRLAAALFNTPMAENAMSHIPTNAS